MCFISCFKITRNYQLLNQTSPINSGYSVYKTYNISKTANTRVKPIKRLNVLEIELLSGDALLGLF